MIYVLACLLISNNKKPSYTEMSISNDFDEKQIADQIVSYLTNHPYAADTLEGITEWWLPSQQMSASSALVQQALDYLVANSFVKIKVNLSGKKVYSLT